VGPHVAQVWTAITQPGPETNLIAKSLKMKQGQDEWGCDGPFLAHLSFKAFVLAGTDTSSPKIELFWLAKRILSTEVQSTDRFDASGQLNRAPVAALSAGIDQVKRAWPWALAPSYKKIRRISQISYCQLRPYRETPANVLKRNSRGGGGGGLVSGWVWDLANVRGGPPKTNAGGLDFIRIPSAGSCQKTAGSRGCTGEVCFVFCNICVFPQSCD
jgi:hypothetical protein